MKKIVSAVALAAAAASLATAEVKITMNGRLRPTVYGQQTVEGDAKGKTDTKAVTKNWMSLDGYAAFEDTLKFAFNNEEKTAGLTFSVNVKNGNDSANPGTSGLYIYTDGDEKGNITTNKDAKSSAGTKVSALNESESNNKFGNFFTLNQYDVWSTVFGTDLKIGAGSWKDGNADVHTA